MVSTTASYTPVLDNPIGQGTYPEIVSTSPVPDYVQAGGRRRRRRNRTTKNKVVRGARFQTRPSASHYYRTLNEPVGFQVTYRPRKGGKEILHDLALRKNGSPYWKALEKLPKLSKKSRRSRRSRRPRRSRRTKRSRRSRRR